MTGPMLSDIVEAVARKHGLEPSDVTGRDYRARQARREAVRVCREMGCTWEAIGCLLDERTIQTVREIHHGRRFNRCEVGR